MSVQELKSLLTQLEQELETTELDADTKDELTKLSAQIDSALSGESDHNDLSPMMEKAVKLETRFASEHPVAERVLREFMDVLVKIGV